MNTRPDDRNWEAVFAEAKDQDQLEQLWKAHRDEVMVKGKFGYSPPKMRRIVMTILMGIFFLIITVATSLYALSAQGIGRALLFLICGLAATAMTWWLVKDERERLPIYRRAHAAYLKRKAGL